MIDKPYTTYNLVANSRLILEYIITTYCELQFIQRLLNPKPNTSHTEMTLDTAHCCLFSERDDIFRAMPFLSDSMHRLITEYHRSKKQT